VQDSVKQVAQKRVNELQQELIQTIKKQEHINHMLEDKDQEINVTAKKSNEQIKYLKELEEREVHMNNEYIQLLEK
jgi:hypothetical protein